MKHRRGSPQRLLGIDLYYDFEWLELFPDERAQFKNGRCLARLALNDCPPAKSPGLLLTSQDDVDEGPIETETDFLVVVNLPRYLSQTSVDAAASYYAHRLESGITGIARLRELAARPEVVHAVLEDQLDLDSIAEWASREEGRIEQLRAIAGTSLSANPPVSRPSDLAAVIASLRLLEDLDSEVIEALEALLGSTVNRDTKLRFLRAVTSDPVGRDVTSEVFGERIGDRLSDARNTISQYESLLAADATETDLQAFIEENPWLVGLEYVRVRPRKAVPRGALDFILERYDGFHDLLELKAPSDAIVAAPDSVDDVPPSASAFTLSPALAQALAQIHVYKDVLEEEATLERLYGLQNTRHPRLIVVIGQARGLPAHRTRVLRDLNLSLHRVEIVPYDALAERAKAILDNVGTYLSVREGSLESS